MATPHVLIAFFVKKKKKKEKKNDTWKKDYRGTDALRIHIDVNDVVYVGSVKAINIYIIKF
jgi:hypothetical protein